MSELRPNCQRWMWIELLGFDNTEPDYGVAAFLDNAGFAPDVLTFHLCCPDFVNMHAGMAREITLPSDMCAYGGRGYNADRARQEWTNFQFRGLVQELQRRGVQVYCSVMDAFASHMDGKPYRSPWSDSHPEIWSVRHTGEVAGIISPLKRLADGTYFEDYFVAKLREVVTDYGFDGFHGADGIGGPRRPLWMGDYSDDMVGQFVAMVPDAGGLAEVPLQCDGDPERGEARAQYIWNNLRQQWCEFHAVRWEQMWTKLCAAMRELGKRTAMNNVWTQEPFGAYLRYGVDYRRIARAGVDALILETVGAGNSIGAEGVPVELRADMNVMLLFMKACLPDMPLTYLNCTGDTTENWDVLNHLPPVCEREHYLLGSMFVQGEGGCEHAGTGPVVCLADGINEPQWRWMARNWVVAYEQKPTKLLSPAILWSEAALEPEFDDYVQHRTLTRHKLCTNLMYYGAPMHCAVRTEHLDRLAGPLFVPRPELLPEAELQAALAHPGMVAVLGRNDLALPAADLTLAEGPGPEQLCLRVYRPAKTVTLPDLPPVPQAELADERPDPPSYIHELYFRPTSEAFLQAAAQVLTALSDVPQVINGVAEARVLAYETAPGWVRVLMGNEAYWYMQPQLDFGREVREVRVASHYPGKPIEPQGTTLATRVPPRGMVVLDVRVG
jgi:hypothetical protein